MIPIVKVLNDNQGTLRIVDLSLDNGLYYLTDDKYESGKLKYSGSYTINSVSYNSSVATTIVDTKIQKHSGPIDEVVFKVDKDGWYTISHIILPSKDWKEWMCQYHPEDLEEGTIYYTDGVKIYKYMKDVTDDEVVAVDELTTRNTLNTNISKVSEDIFTVHGLYACYMKWANLVFSSFDFKRCNTKQSQETRDITFKRDFVWSAINIIQYEVEMCNYMDAQIILEEMNSCNGFCGASSKSVSCGCGI